jgi:hypothetical protein
MVDGGKQFAVKHRKDSMDMGRDIAAIMRSVVRQVRVRAVVSAWIGFVFE